MNDEELKKLWQQQSLRDPAVSAEQVMSAMQKQTAQLRRTLLARDARELVACVFVGVVFGIYYFCEFCQPFVRNGNNTHVGLYRAKRKICCLRLRVRKAIKKS